MPLLLDSNPNQETALGPNERAFKMNDTNEIVAVPAHLSDDEVETFFQTQKQNQTEGTQNAELLADNPDVAAVLPDYYKQNFETPLKSLSADQMAQPNYVIDGIENRARAFDTTLKGFFGVQDKGYAGQIDAEMAKKYPGAALLGGLTAQLPVIMATFGLGDAIGIGKLAQMAGNAIDLPISVPMAKQAMTALVDTVLKGGLFGGLVEGERQSVAGHADAAKIGTAILDSAVGFAPYSVGGLIPSRVAGTAAIVGITYALGKAQGAPEADNLLNSIALGALHAVSAGGSPRESLQAVQEAQTAYVQSKHSGVDKNVAADIVDTHIADRAKEILAKYQAKADELTAKVQAEAELPKDLQTPVSTGIEVNVTPEMKAEEVKPEAPAPVEQFPAEHIVASSKEMTTGLIKKVVEESTGVKETKAEEKPADKSEVNKIADFGEKIGGARKDTAESTGSRGTSSKPTDERPAWQKNTLVMQNNVTTYANRPADNKWYVYKLVKGGRPGEVEKLSRTGFDTEQEAKDSIPLAVVAQNHTVYKKADGTFAIYRKLSNGNRPIVKDGFKTNEEAMKYMATHAPEIIEQKFNFPGKPWLDSIKRVGGQDRGNRDVGTKEFQDRFGFRAGEFGNWNMGSDGQAALNHAYDALNDLADTLGVEPKALSLNGRLAIAFGARGQGLSGATAHFEADKVVINLTKIRGAGSLAHEWMHALDEYVAHLDEQKQGKATTGFKYSSKLDEKVRTAFKNLMNTITAKEDVRPVDKAMADKGVDRSKEVLNELLNRIEKGFNYDYSGYKKGWKAPTAEQLKRFAELKQKIANEDYGDKMHVPAPKTAGKWNTGYDTFTNIDAMNKLFKEVTKRSFDSTDRESSGRSLYGQIKRHQDLLARVKQAGEGATEKNRTSTDYFKESKRIDSYRASEYWASGHEMAARAFETYINDKIEGNKGRSDYLVYGADNKYYAGTPEDFKPFPEGADRQAINGAFDKLFEALDVLPRAKAGEVKEPKPEDYKSADEYGLAYAKFKMAQAKEDRIPLAHDFYAIKEGDKYSVFNKFGSIVGDAKDIAGADKISMEMGKLAVNKTPETFDGRRLATFKIKVGQEWKVPVNNEPKGALKSEKDTSSTESMKVANKAQTFKSNDSDNTIKMISNSLDDMKMEQEGDYVKITGYPKKGKEGIMSNKYGLVNTDILTTPAEMAKEIIHVLSPKTFVDSKALDEIYKAKGGKDKLEFELEAGMKTFRDMFDKQSNEENTAFIDRIKTGQPQPTPELQGIADMMRQVEDAYYAEVQKLKPSATYLENHYRVLWKVVPGSPEARGFKGLFRRPLQGTKGFLKQHTLADMSEGLAKGGEPYSYNPMVMWQHSMMDMQSFITANKMFNAMKKMKMVQFVKFGESAPEGFTKINDSIARKYFPTDAGMVNAGEYYAEEGVGRVLNNYLSPDHVRNSAIGSTLLKFKNLTTSLELSLSTFHAMYESGAAMATKIGLGLQKIANKGDLIDGMKDIATFPVAPGQFTSQGGRAIKYVADPREFIKTLEGQDFIKQFPDAEALVNDAFTGGMKFAIHQDYKTNSFRALQEGIKNKEPWAITMNALPGLNEAVMSPMFEYFIPRLKLGSFLNEMQNAVQVNQGRLDKGQITRPELARQVVDSIENRFGEMNFDNLFWDRSFKSAMQIVIRSVTWKVGALKNMAVAVPEQMAEIATAAKNGERPQLKSNFAYLLGVGTLISVASNIIQRSAINEDPKDFKDLIAPRYNADGDRIMLNTHLKDWIHMLHNPGQFATSSAAGYIGKFVDLMNNKDFYGTEIIHEDDAPAKKAWEATKFLFPTPFSLSQYQRVSELDAPDALKLSTVLGATQPAPGYVSKTAAENKASEIMASHQSVGARTKEAFDKTKLKNKLRLDYETNHDQSMIDQSVNSGDITRKDAHQIVKDASKSKIERMTTHMTADEVAHVIEKANDDELKELMPIFEKKVRTKMDSSSDTERNKLKELRDNVVNKYGGGR